MPEAVLSSKFGLMVSITASFTESYKIKQCLSRPIKAPILSIIVVVLLLSPCLTLQNCAQPCPPNLTLQCPPITPAQQTILNIYPENG